MVATKSAKAVKHSYAERVLGAFTTLQKEHRRHAVHMATLRAQVKKTAQAKQDKLGPQWSNWVGKAVHKLEEEGIFAPAEHTGSLTLTPIGKKAITAARQSLSIPQHATPTPAEEVLIWKQVTQPTSITSRGTKRARRSSVVPLKGNDGGNRELSSTPAKLKRPRISVRNDTPVKKHAAKMTKSELLAELHATQKAHKEALWRATSPLTDLGEDDSEEVARLKEELERKEDEISQMRRALAEAKRQTHSGSPVDDRRLTAPEITDAMPSRARPLQRPAHGVTRNQSGSFISMLSKQPTPQPSTPEPAENLAIDHNSTYDHEEGVNGIQERDHGPSYSLATPAVSPVIPTIEMHDDTQESLQKMSELEHSLMARVLDVRRLEDQLLELQAECSTAVQNLSQSDARVKALQTEILTVENQVSELQEAKNDLEATLTFTTEARDRTVQELAASITALESEREMYLTELADLQNALNQAEVTITSHVAQASIAENEAAALRSAVEAAEASRTVLVNTQKIKDAELQASLTNISQLRQQVSELENYKDKTTETVARMMAENASTSEMLRSAQVDNEYLSKQLSSSTAEKATLEVALATSKDDLVQRNATIERLSDSLIHSHDEVAALRNEIGTLKLSVLTLEKDLGISTKTAEELAAQLVASEKDRTDLAMSFEKAKNTIVEMTLSVEEKEKRLYESKSAAEQFEADAKAQNVVVQDLRLQLAAAQSEAAAVTEQLSAKQAHHVQESTMQTSIISGLEQRLESARTELQSKMREQVAQLREAKLSLEAEQRRSSNLEENLTATHDKVQEVEEELSDVRQSKEADERTIESLKEMFSALRETQMRSLTELDNKVVSAHSSPTPKKRSNRNPGKARPLKLT